MIVYSDDKLPIEMVKANAALEFEQEQTCTLKINKSTEIKGKIIPSKIIHRENLKLFEVYQTIDDEGTKRYKLLWLNQRQPKLKKGVYKIAECVAPFFQYELLTKDNARLRIFSEKPIATAEYTVYGTLFIADDEMDYGYNAKMRISKSLLFVHSVQPNIILFNNHNEFFKFLKTKGVLTYEDIVKFIFYHRKYGKVFRQPASFEKLVVSFLFCTEIEGWPTHILIIAKPGTGKSTCGEAIHSKYDEYAPIIEGSGSTIKSLIPSFKSTTPEPGSLMKCLRLAVADEFLRILLRVEKDDRQHQLGTLNSLMEHKERTFSSGNCQINGSMTARLYAMSNPIWGTSDLDVMLRTLDIAFISRLIVYWQTKEHIDFVHSDQGIIEGYVPPITSENWLSIVDYLNSFKSKYDEKKVREMIMIWRETLVYHCQNRGDNSVLDFFDARFTHHCCCILDGLVKLRSITSEDMTFTAKKKDYDDLEEIVKMLITSWGVTYVTSETV